jgi:hypothetical protein
MTADVRGRLRRLDETHRQATGDGEWRALDYGSQFGAECRYEIVDDEGTVAICSDDNDATATTGAQRTAAIVAEHNALPGLVAALTAVLDLADELDADSKDAMGRADAARSRGRESGARELYTANVRHARVAAHAASAIRAAVAAPLAGHDNEDGGR